MQIDSPDQFMKALATLMMQMNRKQRKQFLMWVKQRRTQYDFQYPEGYKPTPKGEVNVQSNSTTEPVILVPDAPVIVTPEPGILGPDGHTASSETGSESTASTDAVSSSPS